MTTKAEAKPVPTDGSKTPDELFHITCCNDDIALCGLDVMSYSEVSGKGEPNCVVCEDLNKDDIPCSPTCTF
jgi:hypothetical protein